MHSHTNQYFSLVYIVCDSLIISIYSNSGIITTKISIKKWFKIGNGYFVVFSGTYMHIQEGVDVLALFLHENDACIDT